MGIDLDDIQEVCSYESIGITINGYVKIYELNSVNYAGVEPYECILLDDEFITFLLKRYKKMYLYEQSKEWFHKIPEYITHLILDFSNYNNINLDKLHHGLQSLVIICTNGHNENSFNSTLDNLPPTLKTLEIISTMFNQPIDLLPISMTRLTIRSNSFNQSLSNLPSNLYSLIIDICDEYGRCNYLQDELMNLPEGLKQLKIEFKKIPTNGKYKYPGMLKNTDIEDKMINEFENIMEERYPNCIITLKKNY
jgi:hypothetical protein